MKALLTLILTSFFSLQIFATGQIRDILIYKGDTISIYPSPLEQWNKIDSLRPKLFGETKVYGNTACGNDYIAQWHISENQLYLINIFSCDSKTITADLKKLFGLKYIDGQVKADWVQGKFISPQGKLLFSINDAYESLYETDLEFDFKKGKLEGTRLYDNSKSKQSEYSTNDRLLMEFIYSNINWDVLPKQDTIVKVYIQFSANVNGIIDSVKVRRGYSKIYDNEAIRIVKSIPEWNVYYKHGKLIRRPWMIPIVFSEENKLKYKK